MSQCPRCGKEYLGSFYKVSCSEYVADWICADCEVEELDGKIAALQASLIDAQERERKLVERLKSYEWSHEYRGLMGCPACHAFAYELKHRPDCWLSALIEGME